MKNNFIIKILLAIYLFTISWTGALKITPLLSIPITTFLILIFISIFYFVFHSFNYRVTIKFEIHDFFLSIFLLWILTNSFFHPNDKTFNYLASYFLILLGNIFILKNILINIQIDVKTLLKWLSVGVVFIQLFIISEVFFKQFLGIDISSHIPRERDSLSATYLGFINRAYGLSTEPGSLSNYLNVFSPLSIYYISKYHSKFLGGLETILYLISLALTFSAGGIFFSILSFYMVFLFKIISRKKIKPIIYFFAFNIILSIIVYILYYSGYISFVEPLINKLTLTQSSSADDRLSRWFFGFELINNSPFTGVGLGYLSSINIPSVTSWYLFMVIENGFLSLLILIFFYFSCFLKIINSPNELKYYFLFGFFASIMHLAIVSTFQHPFLWCTLGVFFSLYKQKSNQ